MLSGRADVAVGDFGYRKRGNHPFNRFLLSYRNAGPRSSEATVNVTITPSKRARSGATLAITLTAFASMLLLGAPTAGAVTTDNVLTVPVAGIATGPTGLAGPLVGQHVTATTDADLSGITTFSGTERLCACMIHWRNLSTGTAGTANLWFGYPATGGTAVTGSGVLIATVTTSGVGGPITVLPGAGLWWVP